MPQSFAVVSALIAALLLFAGTARADHQYQIQLQGYGSVYDSPETLIFDPDNQFTARPKSQGTLEVFPSYKFENDQVQFVGRGYLRARAEESFRYSVNGSSNEQTTKATADFEELFGTFTTDPLRIVLGLQTYNWGPAELVSPSQYLIPLRLESRSAFYREKGLWAARASLTYDRMNITALGEFADNRETKRRFDEEFEGGGYLKAEFILAKKTNRFVGIVLGHKRENWAGLYGNWELPRGFTAYFDGRVLQKTQIYAPDYDVNQNLTYGSREEKNSTLSDVGIRYEGNFDWRAEYIYNSIGVSRSKFKAMKEQPALWQILNLPGIPFPGTDLPGQDYFYASIRKRDWNRWSFFANNFSSVNDSSQLFFFSVEREVGDAFTLILEGGTPWGVRDGLANFFWPGFAEAGFKAQF